MFLCRSFQKRLDEAVDSALTLWKQTQQPATATPPESHTPPDHSAAVSAALAKARVEWEGQHEEQLQTSLMAARKVSQSSEIVDGRGTVSLWPLGQE